MRRHTRLIIMAVTLVLTASAVRAGVIYDLRSDWSLANNPNGAWSYNKGSTALPFVQPNWGTIPETFWADSTLFTTPPAWARIETQSPLTNPDHWEIGYVVGHSTTPATGGLVPLGNVSWTSPVAGVITVSGRAWDAYHDANRDDQWRLYIDGILVAGRGSVFGLGRSEADALFENNLQPGQSLSGWSVAPGDTVVFEIESLTPLGHLVGVDLSIDLETKQPGEVPEPSQAIPVLAAVAAGLVMRRFRSRRDI